MATIGRYYFRVCTRGAERQGHRAADLLTAAGIDPAALDRPGWRGDVAAMARLVRGIVAATGDEYMGFAATPMRPGAFAFALTLAREGASVRDGLGRAIRFYTLATRAIDTRIVDTDDEVHVSARFADPALDRDHYFGEFWLMIWHRVACWLAGETVPLRRSAFAYPRPAYFEEFRHLFPCPHRFDAELSSIALDRRALARPVVRDAAELEAMLAVAPLDIMTIPGRDDSLAHRVRALLVDDPARDGESVASALAMPLDRVRRRLRASGTSLSAIRERLRRDAAIRALSGGNRSVEEIAAALGYAEPRSFTRAFRGWTGSSPSAYRRRDGG